MTPDHMYQNHLWAGTSDWSQTLGHYPVHLVLDPYKLGEKTKRILSNKKFVCKPQILRSNFLFMTHDQFKFMVIILRLCKIHSHHRKTSEYCDVYYRKNIDQYTLGRFSASKAGAKRVSH